MEKKVSKGKRDRNGRVPDQPVFRISIPPEESESSDREPDLEMEPLSFSVTTV
jgi:hypothetical protein